MNLSLQNILKVIKYGTLPVLIFLVVILTVDYIFSEWIIFNKDFSNQAKLRRLIEHNEANEIPIFGSSKARSSFIPDSISRYAYNYAMEASNFDVIEFLLDIECKKDKSTSIILEFNQSFFVHSPDYTINAATFIPNLNYNFVKDFLIKNDRFEFQFLLPGFRYFGFYFYYARFLLKKDFGTKKIISKGGNFAKLVPKKEVFQNYVNARLRADKTRRLYLNKRNDIKKAISAEESLILDYLNRTLLFSANEERIKVFEDFFIKNPDRTFLVVYTPQHWSELKMVSNYNEILELFDSWEKRFPNLKVFNYANMDLDDDCFKDSSHLNIKGARIFCSQFHSDAWF